MATEPYRNFMGAHQAEPMKFGPTRSASAASSKSTCGFRHTRKITGGRGRIMPDNDHAAGGGVLLPGLGHPARIQAIHQPVTTNRDVPACMQILAGSQRRPIQLRGMNVSLTASPARLRRRLAF